MRKPENALSMLRAWSRMSQADFASAMGVPLRTYEDIETGRSKLRPIHLQAARMALLQLAVEYPEGGYLPMPIEEFIATTARQHRESSSEKT